MPKIPFWVFVLVGLLHLSAFWVDVMDIDAAQYAEISREMKETGSYLQIFDRGRDYLDKPPFLFWVSAASMSVFGVNNLGFKLPSILFALWALYATYRLGRRLYGENTGRLAALVLGVCQGMFLMTNDIRTDTILMSWVITAVWLLKEWEVQRKLKYLILGFGAVAFGMMTKGPIALMVPIFCFATDWALKRKWKMFFRWEYLLGLVVMAILLLPMSIGLYQQFDMHPEKIVNDVPGATSGIEFFYWSQSFGRITGESKWNNGAGIDFLMLNMFWSFLPWILLFLTALVGNVATLIKQRFRLQENQEWLTTGGFILSYLALGSSKFQLPHYIFVAFPFAAIMTAKFLADIVAQGKASKEYRIFTPVQVVLSVLLVAFSFALVAYIFPASAVWYIVWAVLAAIFIYILINKKVKHNIIWASVAAMLMANVFATHYFYPTLIGYQLGVSAPKLAKANGVDIKDVICYRVEDPMNSLHFYAQHVMYNDTNTIDQGKYVLTMQKGADMLASRGFDFDTVATKPYFRVTKLNIQFIKPDTRPTVLKDYYLLKIK